jgi:hypothetical protein
MSLNFEKVRRALMNEDISTVGAPPDEEIAMDSIEADKEAREFGEADMLREQEEDEEEGDEPAEDEGEEEEEEEVEDVSPEEHSTLSKSVDDAIEGVLVDYEARARKSAEIQTESRYSLRRYLLSESEQKLDVDMFATDVARLVKNYDTLLDMEAIIVNKAIQFLEKNYDEETAEELVELLDVRHDIRIGDDPDEDFEQPVAVGGAEGGAGA